TESHSAQPTGTAQKKYRTITLRQSKNHNSTQNRSAENRSSPTNRKKSEVFAEDERFLPSQEAENRGIKCVSSTKTNRITTAKKGVEKAVGL
ncbi:MAG: hypothetical protein ACI4JA_06095, partial [Oscillospiraceae bacterium]